MVMIKTWRTDVLEFLGFQFSFPFLCYQVFHRASSMSMHARRWYQAPGWRNSQTGFNAVLSDHWSPYCILNNRCLFSFSTGPCKLGSRSCSDGCIRFRCIRSSTFCLHALWPYMSSHNHTAVVTVVTVCPSTHGSPLQFVRHPRQWPETNDRFSLIRKVMGKWQILN